MAYDRFMIAPLNSGLQNNVRPWLISNDAFDRLRNAYIYRGQVRKRMGALPMNTSVALSIAQLNTRLRLSLGNSPGPLNVGTAAGQIKIGQMFSLGNDMFTVYQLGAGVLTYSTNATITCTINSVAVPNTVTFAGAGLPAPTTVYYYPANPVMGLLTYERANINDEITIAFDTQYAYYFTAGAWARLGAGVWTGSDSQFFWGCNYRGTNAYDYIFFVVNYNAADLIKYWNGAAWANLNPTVNATGPVTLTTAKIILPFKNRLLALNVIESGGTYVNRCRFSQNGSPLAVDAWQEDIPGKGGWVDAPTREAIVSAEFLKDRLIVFFERSTWELVYTGNDVLPFVWQKINTELGAESTFSVVPFDKEILGVGNVGVHSCNGANVVRIDQKITDEVFRIHNGNEGVNRVYGIRDYDNYIVMWTFPNYENNTTYPNRVLVYNHEYDAWAFFDDSITCFGYFQLTTDITWADIQSEWQDTINRWDDGAFQSQYRKIIAGNQQGFTFLVEPQEAQNSISLSITDMAIAGNVITLTIYNHNLSVGDYILVDNAQGLLSLNNNIYRINTVVDANNVRVLQDGAAGVYTGGGTIQLVSQIEIKTKQYNFYADKGQNAFIAKVDFMVDKTSPNAISGKGGQITVDYQLSSSTDLTIDNAQATGAMLGSGILETTPYPINIAPLEQSQGRLWHPVYLQAEGECIQLNMYLADDLDPASDPDDTQIRNKDIALQDFRMHAMIFYAMPTSDRLI